MADIVVSKNDNGDVLVIVDDIVCVPTGVQFQDKDGEWIAKLPGRIAAQENPRTEAPYGDLSEEDVVALGEAIDALPKK